MSGKNMILLKEKFKAKVSFFSYFAYCEQTNEITYFSLCNQIFVCRIA